VRLVEIYATVRDGSGRHVSDLTQDRFLVRDNGEVQAVTTFESVGSPLRCALLIDTTGSMQNALPGLKNTLLRLIDALRADDWCAVYGFSTSLRLLEEFTRERSAAKRAVLRVQARGATALFDSITQVAMDLQPIAGKKAIVVFTDGADNASILDGAGAAGRVRKLGVPLYTVAQGEALRSHALVSDLERLARTTGGAAFEVKKHSDVGRVFEEISRDLEHTYMLAYAPPAASDGRWRSIQVSVSGLKGARVRAREGYYPF
jgi:VWFA-related protein